MSSECNNVWLKEDENEIKKILALDSDRYLNKKWNEVKTEMEILKAKVTTTKLKQEVEQKKIKPTNSIRCSQS